VEVQLPAFAIHARNFKDVSFTAVDLHVIVVPDIFEKAEAEFDNASSH